MPRSNQARFTAAHFVRAAVSVTVVAIIFLWFLPRIVDYDEVMSALEAMTWMELTSLALLACWNQITYALLEMSARPGLNFRQATTITMTSTAIANTLPAGAALGVGLQSSMYSTYGFASSDIAISLMTTGIWNTFVKLLMPVVAVALVALSGGRGGGMTAAAIVGLAIVAAAVALFAGALRSERGARRAGRVLSRIVSPFYKLLRRDPPEDLGATVASFRQRTVHLVRDRWAIITAAAVVSHLSLFLVLLLALRHVGVSNSELSWQSVFAAFAFVRLISVVPITPGGLGVVELGLTAALVAAGGPEAQVVAAILVFRALTFVFPIPLGLVTYTWWRRSAAAKARHGARASARTD